MSENGRRYAVLGCGRQGTAAAFDLARRGGARSILLLDAEAGRAGRLREWLLERLPGEEAPALETAALDASDPGAVEDALRGADAAVAAVPYRYLVGVTEAAISAGTHCCDLGGHPDTVRAQLERNEAARRAGVAVVPDCGQAPGMATTLTMLAVGMVPEPETVELWDGGLPVDPEPPVGYRLTFDVRGLTNEYDGPAWAIRDGRAVELDSLAERQTVSFPPPLGELEAFTASGTSSTLPWTLEGELEEFTSRIVRYPGHLDVFRALRSLGLLSLDPVSVEAAGDGGRVEVVPRRVTEAAMEPVLVGEGPIEDVVVVRAHCTGRRDGEPVRAEVDLMTFSDPEAGLTAMQRCTGFDAAVVAAMAARGEVEPGISVRERSVDPDAYVRELGRRDIRVESRLLPRG